MQNYCFSFIPNDQQLFIQSILCIWNLKIYFRLDLPWQLYLYHICGLVENQKSQNRRKEGKFGGWNLNYMTPLLINDLTTWIRHISFRMGMTRFQSFQIICSKIHLFNHRSDEKSQSNRDISSINTIRNKSNSPTTSSSSSSRVKNANYGTDRDTNVKRTVGNVVIS